MLVWQADPDTYTTTAWGEANDYPALWESAYQKLLDELRTQAKQFGKPVVVVHGDSHYFRIDHPMPIKSGSDFSLTNLTRVETFGNPNMDWVSATINPSDPNVFSFKPMVVPGNAQPPKDTDGG